MNKCDLCPRNCKVDRELGEKGFCHEAGEIRIARASLHMWEEPPISGEEGSGTVFFSGCPLLCVYCQNYNIADDSNGVDVSIDELSSIFLHLEEKGARNINLVTPTQFVPKIRAAIIKAKGQGLQIPFVYNTSSYENVDTIKLLTGLIDVYLPDLKYVSKEISKKYSRAEDYFEVATKAIDEMVRQQQKTDFENGNFKGVIVRHMVLPGQIEDSKAVLKYLYEKYKDNIYISIMSQYTPISKNLSKYPEIDRKVTKEEYDELIDFACDLGITKAFVQEGDAAKESFIPDFENFDLNKFLET